MRLVFWQPCLSLHQSASIRALAELGHEVTLAVERDMGSYREQMGWHVPDFGSTRVLIAPGERAIRNLIEGDVECSLHLLAGTMAYPLVRTALIHCLRRGVRPVVVAEAADPRGLAGWGRRWMYRAESLFLKGRLQFMLPMGDLGVRWFVRSGFGRELCFPYAYAVEHPLEVTTETDETTSSDEFRMAFVGSCIRLKAIDTLLEAAARIGARNWSLQIIGDGDRRVELERLTRRLDLQQQVRFWGMLKNREVLRLVRKCDLLVLPSHYDGWGAVVNESLMLGVPVVCSDRCGAADLVREPWRGTVYRGGSIEDLLGALERQMQAGKLTSDRRERIKRWAECISGPSLARYLLAVIEYVREEGERPTPPWRRSQVGQPPLV
ncbi:MAG: glycosyltransferase [Bradymonadales bacterium]|nr:glycosyltransferase [Bradymonadales bacterium]